MLFKSGNMGITKRTSSIEYINILGGICMTKGEILKKQKELLKLVDLLAEKVRNGETVLSPAK